MNRYREMREELGLKQVQLARILGTGQATISGHEIGKKVPRSRLVLLALLYLQSLPRAELDALLANPSKLDESDGNIRTSTRCCAEEAEARGEGRERRPPGMREHPAAGHGQSVPSMPSRPLGGAS